MNGNLWRMMMMLGLMVAMVTITACGDVGDAPEAATDSTPAQVDADAVGSTYEIDTDQSAVLWKAAKVTDSHDGGFGQFSGEVRLDGDRPSYAMVTIDMESIFSDSEKLTGHLKSGDFFLTEEHPTARFEASSFTPIDTVKGGYMVSGNLTIRGTTNGVTFPATIRSEAERLSIAADFIIDRQNWGISYAGAPDNLIEDNVRLILDVVAVPQNASASTAAVFE